MGSIMAIVPDFSDADLIFDDSETKQILQFFWPNYAAQINQFTITNHMRQVAQTALVGAIERTHSMGIIETLWKSSVNPSQGVKSLAKKMAKNYAKHWWKNTKQRDLENVKIYDMVRNEVARNLRGYIDGWVAGE